MVILLAKYKVKIKSLPRIYVACMSYLWNSQSFPPQGPPGMVDNVAIKMLNVRDCEIPQPPSTQHLTLCLTCITLAI